jgi:hypothetical protein
LRLWQRDFRKRWGQALAAQVRAILMCEGWSAVSGVIALMIILSATAWVAFEDAGNAALLIGLMATLPRMARKASESRVFRGLGRIGFA